MCDSVRESRTSTTLNSFTISEENFPGAKNSHCASSQKNTEFVQNFTPRGKVSPLPPVPQIQISAMDTFKSRSNASYTNSPAMSINSGKAHGGKTVEKHLFERREKVGQGKPHPRPVVHPDMTAQAQSESEQVYRFAEDSRPMFSPVPKEVPDGDDSPRSAARTPKDRTSFPSIHVEKCEKTQPAYAIATPRSPEPTSLSPDSDLELEAELVALGQGEGHDRLGCGGRLYVPSPYQHHRTDGRTVLLTGDSNRGLSSWSRSEGNLPDAVRRSTSSPSGHMNLLDIKHRPDWVLRPTLRPSSDVALHEYRREGKGAEDARTPAPRRLNVRLEPLNTGQRALSASNLHDP